MATILLPGVDGKLEEYQTREVPLDLRLEGIPLAREVYAALHIVANPNYNYKAAGYKITPDAIDWDKTLEYRLYIWSLRLGAAEAMDTSQRGSEIGWEIAKKLIEITGWEAKKDPEKRKWIGGAGADLVKNPNNPDFNEIVDSYVEQANFIANLGGKVIFFPTPMLPDFYSAPENYPKLIKEFVKGYKGKFNLHWLGEAFNEKMRTYWGYENIWEAAERNVIPIMTEHKDQIEGIKLSLLDKDFEWWFRRQISKNGQVVYTGDDFNYSELIKGKNGDFSHALLGILDGIALVAAKTFEHLTKGEIEKYDSLMEPTVPLSRHIFKKPTQYYKLGLVFLAYLNGHQDHFTLVGGIENNKDNERDLLYYVELFKLAEKAGVLRDTKTAYERFKVFLEKRYDYKIPTNN